MYRISFYISLLSMLGVHALTAAIVAPSKTPTLASGQNNSNSTFEYLDVQDGALAQQIIIKAAKPITCKKHIDNEKHQFVLDISGLTLSNLDQETIRKKIEPLLGKGYINRFELEAATDSARFILTFTAKRQIMNTDTNEYEDAKNSVLIRSCAYTKHFTIDIYTKDALDGILQKTNNFIRLAENKKKNGNGPLLAMNEPAGFAPLRYVIDAGHGGDDQGAKAHNGLTEKEVTLDISKRVHRMLQERNCPVYMTRYKDTELPLAERAQLAQQMQGDLFISIHANGAVNEKAHGIEAYYFPAKELQSHKNFDFVFINQPKNVGLVKKIQEHVGLMAQSSYQLAHTILQKIHSGLSAHYDDINNRGTKPENFRLFLQNMSIPTALIEVGFLTNRKEADRLKQKSYRKCIAQQIVYALIGEGSNQSAAAA